MTRVLALRLLEAGSLALLYILGYGFPAASGHGGLEAIASFLFPLFLFAALFRGRSLGWLYLALVLGFAGVFSWVPHTVAVKGELPPALGLLSGVLLMAWEALGLLGVLACARWSLRKGGPWAACCSAALALLLWEIHGFHIYPWSLGASLGGLPWLALGAAFVSAHGLAALLWGCAAHTGSRLAAGERSWPLLAGPAALLGVLLGLAALWPCLPRAGRRELDVVMIQPNFEPGVRRPGMEAELWLRSDAELQASALPHPGTATLLLWPESSVLGRADLQPNPRLRGEASRRNIGWLFGTEDGLYNLARGEAAGQTSFLQAKIEPMPFGERMPGPPFLRLWLDRNLGFLSQEPGTLTAASSFQLPTPQGPLRVHPLLCSEALSAERVQDGLHLAGGELLANLTNDGWFEKTQATDLHAAQIRMRAVEAGLPLVRATLTGKSGVFRENGTWALWGQPMTQAAYSFHLSWRPVFTPARNPWVLRAGMALLALAWAILCFRPRTAAATPASPDRP